MKQDAEWDVIQSCVWKLFSEGSCSLVMFDGHELVEPILADVEHCSDWVEEWHAGAETDDC